MFCICFQEAESVYRTLSFYIQNPIRVKDHNIAGFWCLEILIYFPD
ncbi:hypothetical protein HMPREF0204_12672 [Chryseobacterium gleum ATCC 35910]|uniref:Uncharacterized protein n=1 Tax=Chryseobacterium gleum ATCC 35910 TaxID=525257 RepID=A0ABN0AKP5_CHRGE|nr:hypothetical protein HMPREF0204_12672 [Chryseobacterium gleum ATCC 35910]